MSKERSPRADCSTTIGTSGIFQSLFLAVPRRFSCFFCATDRLHIPQPSTVCNHSVAHSYSRREEQSPMTLTRSGREPADAEQVRRSVELDAAPAEVWDALTAEALLGEWLADEVELEAEPGGEIVCRYADGEERRGEGELGREAQRRGWAL